MRKLVMIALVVDFPDDFPRYSDEAKDQECRNPSLRYGEAFLRDKANDSPYEMDVLDWVENNLVFYFSDSDLHPDRQPRIVESEIVVEEPLPDQSVMVPLDTPNGGEPRDRTQE